MQRNWQRRLRDDLRDRAQKWAAQSGLPFYMSEGDPPTVLFKTTPDGTAHGNFHPLSWQAIMRRAAWSSRLAKPHSQRDALPADKRASAKELDSSNSSDALLMSCFCFPGAADLIPTKLGLPYLAEVPEFGFAPLSRPSILKSCRRHDNRARGDEKVGNLAGGGKSRHPNRAW